MTKEEARSDLMSTPKMIMLIIMLVYADFAIWYSAEMHNIWNDEKRKFRGILFKFWDWLSK